MDPRTLVLLEEQIKKLCPGGSSGEWIFGEDGRKGFGVAIRSVLRLIPDTADVKNARTRLENYRSLSASGSKIALEGYYDFDWMDVEDWSIFPKEEEV